MRLLLRVLLGLLLRLRVLRRLRSLRVRLRVLLLLLLLLDSRCMSRYLHRTTRIVPPLARRISRRDAQRFWPNHAGILHRHKFDYGELLMRRWRQNEEKRQQSERRHDREMHYVRAAGRLW